jgi:hypothetical protein
MRLQEGHRIVRIGIFPAAGTTNLLACKKMSGV